MILFRWTSQTTTCEEYLIFSTLYHIDITTIPVTRPDQCNFRQGVVGWEETEKLKLMKHKVIAESLVNMGNVCSSNNNNKVQTIMWRQLPCICDTRNICPLQLATILYILYILQLIQWWNWCPREGEAECIKWYLTVMIIPGERLHSLYYINTCWLTAPRQHNIVSQANSWLYYIIYMLCR